MDIRCELLNISQLACHTWGEVVSFLLHDKRQWFVVCQYMELPSLQEVTEMFSCHKYRQQHPVEGTVFSLVGFEGAVHFLLENCPTASNEALVVRTVGAL